MKKNSVLTVIKTSRPAEAIDFTRAMPYEYVETGASTQNVFPAGEFLKCGESFRVAGITVSPASEDETSS